MEHSISYNFPPSTSTTSSAVVPSPVECQYPTSRENLRFRIHREKCDECQGGDSRDQLALKQLCPGPHRIEIVLGISTYIPETLLFAKSLRNMENGQKAMVNLIGSGKGVLRELRLRLISHQEHMQLERGCIRLIVTLIQEHFSRFNELSPDMQISLLKSYGGQLLGIRRVVMTEQTFPHDSPPCRLCVLHPGCILDKLDLESFFTDGEGDDPERNKMLTKELERFERFRFHKFRPLAVTPMEIAALCGIQLWNCVSRFVPLDGELNEKRNALFAELLFLVTQQSGNDANTIAIRMGQLLGLLQEFTILTHQLNEFLAMAKIFFTTVPCSWEEMLESSSSA